MLSFADLLRLVRGQVPLIVEVKRNKQPPPRQFLEQIAVDAADYSGPLALMSFDRDILKGLRRLAPGVGQGWIVGVHQLAVRWWAAPRARRERAVARLLATAPCGIVFLAVDVRMLREARTFIAASGLSLALFTWTIRNARERRTAARWADAAIFEGYAP